MKMGLFRVFFEPPSSRLTKSHFKSALHHTSSWLGEVVGATSVFGLFVAPAGLPLIYVVDNLIYAVFNICGLLKSTVPAHVRA